MPINSGVTQQFSKFELLAKEIVEGFLTGLHRSPFHGFSVEFAEHKAYNQGESIKNIDWKLFARTDKLYTKKYEEETNLRCHILVDCSDSMRVPDSKNKDTKELNKLGFSLFASAAIMHIARKQRDAVGLTLFDDQVLFNSSVKNNQNHINWLMDQMENQLNEKSTVSHGTNISMALKNIAEQSKKRSLVILFTDFLQRDNSNHIQDLTNELKRLKHKQHEIIVFHVLDEKLEVDFDFHNSPTKFVDKESGESIKLTPNEVKELYKKAKKEEIQHLKNSMLNHRIEYVSANINEGFNSLLMSYLSKRKNA